MAILQLKLCSSSSTMASSYRQDDKKKKNNNKNKNKAVATPTKKPPIKRTSTRNTPVKKTPIKRTPSRNTPVKKTPKQDQDKKMKKKMVVVNGRFSQSPEVITSSSSDSQEIQHTPRRKPDKTNKRKQNARNDEEEEEDGSVCKFPMTRIKRIIKSEDPSLLLPQDVVFLVNKATEKFLEQFCEEAYDCSARDRKKALAYKHLSTVVSEKRRFDFLSDFVPEKLKAEISLEQRKLVEHGQV